MPVPQITALLSASTISCTNDVEAKLKDVKYSSRYAMALFYDRPGDFLGLDPGVCAKYIDNDPVFRYMSVDTVKRNVAGKTIT